jgi:hypothetical protein
MPTAITKKPIVFANNREAKALFPSAGVTGQEIVEALEITPPKPGAPKPVILIIGGADSIDEKVSSRLTQLFGRGIARGAAGLNAVIIDGGTEAGVMKMMGQGVADRGFKSALIGVAPLGLVNYPGSEGDGKTPLDPNHSHFVLVEGKEWGSETSVIFKLVGALAPKGPSVVLLAGGGAVSKDEALQAVRQNLPLVVIEGSGGVADEIATAWKAKPDLPDDPLMAEIVADGRIEFHLLSNSVRGAERLLVRALGGDNVLMQAWERFADYDLNANLQQWRFERLQKTIIGLGILATALALIQQKGNPNGIHERWHPWWYVYSILLLIPITLTILITAANRFKQGNKWLLLRGGAEAIKREIYRYRTRAGDYKGVVAAAPATTPEPGTTPTPLPTPEQVLAQRVEDVTRRVMSTEVNTSSLIPYRGAKFPPDMGGEEGADDGFTTLTPDRYVQVRLGDQLAYYQRKAVRLEGQLKVVQWSIYIIGGMGTLLAAINQQIWIALTTAVAAALTTYLSYQQTESSLIKYNQAATDLANVKSWWTALPAEDQGKQENVDALVDHTEKILQSELDGWVQQMQNALAELRKGQEKAPENESTPGSGGGAGTQTDEQKAAADKAAADKAAADKAATDKAATDKAATDKAAANKAAADKAAADKADYDKAAADKADDDEEGGGGPGGPQPPTD